MTKATKRENDRRYYLAHRELIKARSAKWRKENPDKYRGFMRKYRENNRKKVRDYARKYFHVWKIKSRDKYVAMYMRRDRETQNKKAKLYYYKNHDRHLAYVRKYREMHVEKARESFRRWASSTAGREKLRKYQEENREAFRAYCHNRRARLKGNIGSFSHQEWANLKIKYEFTCPRCYKKEPEIKLTIDHIIPVFLGGSNNIENIQPLCGRCNSSKGIRLEAEYQRTK